MGFEYEDEELELKTKAGSFKFRAPSAVEQKAIMRKFKEIGEDTDVVDLYVDFFESLGLAKDITSTMSFKGLMGLFEYAVGSKKN